MKNKIKFFAMLFFLIIANSGCENIPLDNMVQTTSIVGQIGNVNKQDTQFLVEAFFENDPTNIVAQCLADENGYFQILLLEEGIYILKVDYIFAQKEMEYSELYKYNEQKVRNIKVISGQISNVGVIYTSIYDVYLKQVIEALESEGTLKIEAHVEPFGKGLYSDYDPVNDTFENRQKYNRAFAYAFRDGEKFDFMYKTLQNNSMVKILLKISYI